MSWLGAAAWFASDDASPAACRMSLHLAFVVYVLCATGSRMPDEDRWVWRWCSSNWARSSHLPSKILQSSLDAYIQRLSPSPQEGSEEEQSPMFRTQAKLTHAMVLSLLGVFQPLRFDTPFPHCLHRSLRQTRTHNFVHTGPQSS